MAIGELREQERRPSRVGGHVINRVAKLAMRGKDDFSIGWIHHFLRPDDYQAIVTDLESRGIKALVYSRAWKDSSGGHSYVGAPRVNIQERGTTKTGAPLVKIYPGGYMLDERHARIAGELPAEPSRNVEWPAYPPIAKEEAISDAK